MTKRSVTRQSRGLYPFVIIAGVGMVAAVMALWLYLNSFRTPAIVGGAGGLLGDRSSPPSREATEQELFVARRALDTNGIIALGIERFRLRMGRYPKSLDELVNDPNDPQAVRKWDGPYVHIPRLLTDPWGNAYQYQFPGAHNEVSYDLWTCGPDGVNGNGDDIGNW